MENIKVLLPQSGYTAELKGYIDNRTYTKYLEVISSETDIQKGDEEIKIKASTLLKGNLILLEGLLIVLYDENQTVLEPAYEKLNELDYRDVGLLNTKIQEMMQASSGEEKKIG